MPPDPLIASAFVQVLPEPKSLAAFPRTVKTQLTNELKKSPVTVPVKVQLLAFKRDIQTQLRQAAFTVPVEPVLAPNFREKVQTQARTALAGLTIPVTVGALPVGGGAPAGGTGTGGGAARGTTAAALEQRRVKITEALTVANRGLATALAEVNDVDLRRRLLSEAVTRQMTAERALDKELAASTKVKTKAHQDFLATTQAEIAALRTKLATEQAALKTSTKTGTVDKARAAAAEAATGFETKRVAILDRIAAGETRAALATSELSAARTRLRALTAADAAIQKIYDKAIEDTTFSLTQEGQATIANIAATRDKIATDLAAATAATDKAVADERAGAAAARRASREALAARGGAATGLAALGARGATLAASAEFLAGAAVVTAFAKSVQLAANLEQELNVFQQTAAATATQMEAVSAQAIRLGRDITLPTVSAGDAAGAMTELAKAGLSVEDSMAAAAGTLQLATAAEIENAQATELVASGLNAFGLAGTEAIHVADLLTGAANESQGSIADMGVALQQSSAAARQAGFSIEDTVALLTILARNGLRGSDAGTSLRTSLIRLINPTKKAQAEIDKLGVNIRDASGAIRPEVYADFGSALANLTAKQRDATLAIIFGQDAFRAAAIFAREGRAGLDEMREATNQAGLTAQLAGARTKGFSGDIEALRNNLETLGTTLGTITLGPLSAFVEGIDKGVGHIADFAEAVQKVGKVDVGEILPIVPAAQETGTTFGDVFGKVASEAIGHALSLQFLGLLPTFALQGERLGDALFGDIGESLNREIAEAVADLPSLLSALRAIRGEEGALGTGTVGPAVAELRKLRDGIQGSSEEAQALRAQLDALERALVALGRVPTVIEFQTLLATGALPGEVDKVTKFLSRFEIPVKAGFSRDSLVFLESEAEHAADRAGEKAKTAFQTAFSLDPALARAAGFNFVFEAGEGGAAAADAAGKKAAGAFTQSFSTAIAVAQAEGNQAVELSLLQQQLGATRRRRARLEARFDKSPGPNLDAGIKAQAQEESRLEGEIERIQGERASERKEAADNIVKARNEADQAFLDAMNLREGRLSNAILRAGASAGTADDIKTHTALRDFFKKKKDEAAKTIKDAQTKAQVVQQITTKIIQENQTIADLIEQAASELDTIFELRVDIASTTGNVSTLRRLFATRLRQLEKALREAIREAGKNSQLALELRDKINDTRKDAFDAINEGFELDISFAETTGGEAASVRAREAYIRQLQREQAFYKRGSLEWKRIRNEIAEQRKAISEARGEASKMFTELSFQFLTTQQGFFANVMGNLLPSGAVGGTLAGRLAAGGGGGGGGGGNFGAGGTGGGPDLAGLAGFGGAAAAAAVRARGTGGIGSPADLLDEQGRVSAAESRGGFSASQAATVIALLRQMVKLLGGIDTKGKHPEARRSQRSGGSNMDVM